MNKFIEIEFNSNKDVVDVVVVNVDKSLEDYCDEVVEGVRANYEYGGSLDHFHNILVVDVNSERGIVKGGNEFHYEVHTTSEVSHKEV